jgi:hypothetical protein
VAALHEAHRQMAEHRRSLHGNLANRILSHGTEIRIERLSYRAWQRGRPAPSSAAGYVVAISGEFRGHAGGV